QLEVELQVGNALRVDGLFGLDGAQHRAQHIDRLQQQVRHGQRDLHTAAAQLIQQRLEAVCEGGDVREAERGAAALDRVGDAEDGVDELAIRSADIQLQQRRFHRVERLEALLEEGIVELSQIDGHEGHSGSPSTAATPSRCAAELKAGAAPRHSIWRPRDCRSRTKAAINWMPAVSMRCTAAMSRARDVGSRRTSRSPDLRAALAATVQSADSAN